ncbi:hypothetical protein E0Z10_g1074 [Xylaria hypoxylon]|uniref:LrgB-like protein n=1 Tax=Xylaria hypoxylon TaxID=37992 RepID=A0A4Z0ZDJ4_9PEZI|nr:hypothetical protein E0Z10_g1074 [Xylaria hypoxylon]
MEITLVQKLCKSLQTPALAKRYSDAAVGLILIFCIQLLVLPTQIALDLHSVNLPASILVMFLVLFTMAIASSINGDIEKLYNKHLRGPTDFLGRHMSFGFVAFFVLLIRDHIDSSSDIPKLAGVFVLTTTISYVASFLLASVGFRLEQRLRRPKQTAIDLESNNKTWPSPSIAWPALPYERQPKRISQLSTLSKALSTHESLTEITKVPGSSTATPIEFVLRTAPIWIWLFLLTTIGLPVYLATDYVMPFEVFSFTLFWIISIQIQRSLRSSHILLRFCHLRSFCLIFSNPLVLTWALATAYMWAKTLYTGRDIDTIIGEFRHYSSLSKCIINIVQDHDVPAHLGAGDLAGLLLDAGVACMGFKMYEYRSELWASLGTVSFTCTALAAINVFLNVLVAHGFGLQANEAIAFASRSATLALAIPAIENLGGSTTLTSIIAIFSGILFQMAGDWLFSLMRINDRVLRDTSIRPLKVPIPTRNFPFFKTATPVGSTEMNNGNSGCCRTDEESATVAAGVTVGINAAAMGTAYLIERDSRAVAYSALSMIVFGAATVAITALPGAAEAIIFLASR